MKIQNFNIDLTDNIKNPYGLQLQNTLSYLTNPSARVGYDTRSIF